MPQSLIQLPKEAEFKIGDYRIRILDHRVLNGGSLVPEIIDIINDPGLQRDTLYQFEKHGISFEMVIEYCVRELECRGESLAMFMYLRHGPALPFTRNVKGNDRIAALEFSASVAGGIIMEEITEKIRSCDNWGDLYDELHHTSQFHKYIDSRIIRELKE